MLVAGRLAVAQLQAVQVHGLPAGQAHVAAAGPSAEVAFAVQPDRYGRQQPRQKRRIRGVRVDARQDGCRSAVGARALRPRPGPVPVHLAPVGVALLRAIAAGRVQPRFPFLRRRPETSRRRRHNGADQRRERRADAAPGPELPRGRRPGDRVRGRGSLGTVFVLRGSRQLLHRAQAARRRVRAIRGRTPGHRGTRTGWILRAYRHHGVAVLRRGGQTTSGTVRMQVLRARAGWRVYTQRPVRSVPQVRDRGSAGAQTPAGVFQGGHRQAVRQRVVPGRTAFHRQRRPVGL